jgi:broad specificity phosphatase PhoE
VSVLTELGKEQAVRTREALKRMPFDRCYVFWQLKGFLCQS